MDPTLIPPPSGFSAWHVVIALTRRWRELVSIIAAVLLLGILCSFLIIKPSYTSTVSFLPPNNWQTEKRMSSGLCTALLSSQSVSDQIVRKLQLQAAWKLKSASDARNLLKSRAQIEATNFDLMKVTVRDHNPKLASDIANQYVVELNELNTRLARSNAAYRYGFLDRQAVQENEELRQAEAQLQQIQRKSGLIDPRSQTLQTVQAVAQLRAAIAAKNVELEAMRSYASDTNPSALQLRSTVAELKRQLSERVNSSKTRSLGDTQVPLSKLAELALEQQRAVREAGLRMKSSMQVQLQAALSRMNAGRPAPAASIVDHAVTADYKSGPQRLILWAAACWVGCFTGCLYLFVTEALARSGYDTERIRVALLPSNMRAPDTREDPNKQ